MALPPKFLGKGTIVNAAGVIVYVFDVKPFGKSRPVIESEELNPPTAYPQPFLGDQEVSEMEITYYYSGADPLETAFDTIAMVTATITLPDATTRGPTPCFVRSVAFEPITKRGWVSKKAILVRAA